ncbi:MAG: dickkopf-related protein [archaeon]|nr:dickkopf-related protein [archaeon]
MVEDTQRKKGKVLGLLLVGTAGLLALAAAVKASTNNEPEPVIIFPFCSDNLDCPNGTFCAGGFCLPFAIPPIIPPVEGVCENNNDCNEGDLCVNGECLPFVDLGECLVDRDCGVNQRCEWDFNQNQLHCVDIPECEFTQLPAEIVINQVQNITARYNNLEPVALFFRGIRLRVMNGATVIKDISRRLDNNVPIGLNLSYTFNVNILNFPTPECDIGDSRNILCDGVNLRQTCENIQLDPNLPFNRVWTPVCGVHFDPAAEIILNREINNLRLEVTFYNFMRLYNDPIDQIGCFISTDIPIFRG